ncbi:helix-turn-helix domain-containing protein [Flagellimonas sp. HMM57]|uniref:helix-turn-helix domain-containing protein n=1 Tax=unclassified Flagellimonas TaxID=2644544 RepID=UPI0013CFA173|nr:MULTISPECIES: helix-turn-helix domain-containing protein [unclassified Flagellimonas]UII77387.1 helix-turn-helix domain-containing protein [Flagellimonas sp. HMM57]
MNFTKPKIEKYSSNKLSYQKAKEIFERVDYQMVKQQLFLDPQLSLKKISTELAVNERQLSQTINQVSKKNFSDYINSYRVEHAKSLLLSNDHNHLKILGVAFESGFNSKDSFYTSFKKFTGKTPNQFRKQKEE